jgi:two-component system chemotaxis response regulator CheB
VIAQHIPAVFSAAFADRLNQCCELSVREAVEGDALQADCAYIAPGNRHLRVANSPAGYILRLDDGPKINYQRPAVDVLFESVASAVGRNAMGVLLTGMGKDGAEGLLALRNAGARTIAQDESTCVVFGMPREAIQIGAAEKVMPLPAIAPELMRELCSSPATK